jgi:hypothetical protein
MTQCNEELLEFARHINLLIDLITKNFYDRDHGCSTEAHYQLGIIAQFVSGEIQEQESLKYEDQNH